jgi:ATP-dependent DNA helicase RecQ
VIAVARALETAPGSLSIEALASDAGVSLRRADAIVAALVDAGLARQHRDRRVRAVSRPLTERAEQLVSVYAELQAADRHKLDQMIVYCQTAMCRWSKILEYFDDDASLAACGHCDRCERDQSVSVTSSSSMHTR